MNEYRIRYIDGHDLRYKVHDTRADNVEDAVKRLWNIYDADFDHAIISITENGVLVFER